MKKVMIISMLLLTTEMLLAQTTNMEISNIRHSVTNSGIGLGTAIAVVASWSKNKSIRWAILHGILSWFYVIYYAFNRK
ncbi:hypothetical protein [Riemerella anatipestifer]|uniref:hypothetical protein n=1 Tax=Riemerella anatipestifer TaxID=34085 RepID=UPI0009BAA1D1|nr:hypothetical protein [Riemerella anatipestifer]